MRVCRCVFILNCIGVFLFLILTFDRGPYPAALVAYAGVLAPLGSQLDTVVVSFNNEMDAVVSDAQRLKIKGSPKHP